MTDIQKMRNDLINGEFNDISPKINITGVASLANPKAGISCGISFSFTTPDGYVLTDCTCYSVILPSDFTAVTSSAIHFFLIVPSQPTGTWNGIESTGPMPANSHFPVGSWLVFGNNNNSIDAANKEFNLNVGLVNNPSVKGVTGEFMVWVNVGLENNILVTCPGIEIT